MKKRLLVVLLMLIIPYGAFCGDKNSLSRKEERVLLQNAEANFENKNHLEALDQYTQLYSNKPNNLYYKTMVGICSIYEDL